MSIIQTIREKGAVIVIALIAISLISFILMDSMSSHKYTGVKTMGINVDKKDILHLQ